MDCQYDMQAARAWQGSAARPVTTADIGGDTALATAVDVVR